MTAQPLADSTPEGARSWLDQLQLSARLEHDWRETASKIVERYRDDEQRRGARLNILASNVQVLKPSIFSQVPSPDVRRRNILEDPATQATGREVAKLLERALAYAVDDQPLAEALEAVRDDMLLTGRGVSRIVYEATIERRTDLAAIPGPIGLDGIPGPTVYVLDGQVIEPEFDGKGQPFVEVKTDERVIVKHVFWSDFRMSPARSWGHVPWCAFRHTMTRPELVKEFGPEIGNRVTLSIGGQEGETRHPDPLSGSPADPPSRKGRAEVWELWNRPTKERIWLAIGHDQILRRDPDPLNLRDFFPAPQPVYSPITTTDSMIPVPESQLYKDQLDEIDERQSRIPHLERVLKAVVLVDGDFTEVRDIAAAVDGQYIPINRPDVSAGNLAESVYWWPIERVVSTIQVLQQRVQELKAQIWEISGLSDIQRGSSKERESAAAQRIKSSYSGIRMTPRSLPMARHCRDLYRIMAEVMAELFEPATLQRIAGVMITPEMVDLLRAEKLRNVSVVVATDATVAPNILAEREEAVEFLSAATGFLTQVAQVAQVMPAVVPLMLETFRQTARTMKWSRTVEPMIEQTIAVIGAQVQAALQPPQLPAGLPPMPGVPGAAPQPMRVVG